MMKKVGVVALMLVVFGASTSRAVEPDIEIGLKGGINSSTLGGSGTDGVETGTKTGGVVGAFLRFNFGDRWALQQELIYTEKGGKASFLDTLGTEGFIDSLGNVVITNPGTPFNVTQLNMNYLEIPVIGIFNIIQGKDITPSIYGGAALGFRVAGEAVGDTSGVTVESTIGNMNGVDLGGVLGAAVKITTSSVFLYVDARYTTGFANQFEDRDDVSTLRPGGAEFNPNHTYIGNRATGEAPDVKNRAISFTAGISISI